MDPHYAWNLNEEPMPRLEKVEEDKSWLDLLPAGSTVVSSSGHGASYWSRSARIDVRLPSGAEQVFFIKLTLSDIGLVMVRGEYEGMKALYAVSRDIIPEPIGYGTFMSDPNTHFFLCEFVDMKDELPDLVDFCKLVADHHHRSMAMSSNGMFGFPVTTCNGSTPQDCSWDASWEAFFTRSLQHKFRLLEEIHGPNEEIQGLLPVLFDKVCPRLLRPLETEGRVIRPCLLHGDLWDGNVSVHADSDLPYLFDAAVSWGHNEFDLSTWRPARFRFGRAHVKEYFRHFPISPPEEDWDDRNLLYSLRADLDESLLFPLAKRFYELAIITLKELTEKFPKGYEGTSPPKQSTYKAVEKIPLPQNITTETKAMPHIEESKTSDASTTEGHLEEEQSQKAGNNLWSSSEAVLSKDDAPSFAPVVGLGESAESPAQELLPSL
ncbi:hypothetical protein MMC18_007801 [Xylographa bjoerkii]|nr:hypothetical protein [Xylographa bjoerkii]